MSQLFGRRLLCSVSFNDPKGVFSETMRLSTDPIQRRIKFDSTKSWKQEPNTCDLTVYNLSPDMRAQLSLTKTPTIKLAAGYGGDENLTQIFYGQAIYVKHEIPDNSGDIITTISTTDGGEQKQKSRIQVSFGPNTRTSQVLQRIVQELGIKPGNLDKVVHDLDAGIKASIFSAGITISGNAGDELGHLCRSVGYDYSIQDGQLQMLKLGTARDDFEVVLSSGAGASRESTGLIGSPSISNKGVVSGTCLIFKAGAGLDLVPGRRIRIDAEFLRGSFIIAKTQMKADNFADEWYCDFEAVAKKGDFQLVK
jgi:hypothetical protein